MSIVVQADWEDSSLSASGLTTASTIRVYSGTVDLKDVEAAMEAGVLRWQNRMFQEATTFLYLYLPEKTGALLRSYINNILNNKEIWSGLVYAMFVEMMTSATNWTKPTSKAQAIAQLDQYLTTIQDRILEESLEEQGLEVY